MPRIRFGVPLLLIPVLLLIGLSTFFYTRFRSYNRFPSPLTSIVSQAAESAHNLTSSRPSHDLAAWEYIPSKHANRYAMTNAQCDSAFPHLYREIDRAVTERTANPIRRQELDMSWRFDGMVRCMIHDNQLYIIDAHGITNKYHRPRALGTLHAIHRAVTSATEELPDIEFTLSVHDDADLKDGVAHTTWAYSRLPTQKKLWLIPDFSFWAWPDVNLRSWPAVRQRIASQSILDIPHEEDMIKRGDLASERGYLPPARELSFSQKTPQLIWRGALGVAPGIRGDLVRASQDHSWSAVKAMDWSNKTDVRYKLISMEEHCRYQFVAQTEGNTYSARLKYLLNCGSLVLAHEMRFLEHFTHLLRSEGPEQNFALLRMDWKDLPRLMGHWLTPAGSKEARQIAQRSKEVFRDRYLTPAAEACYFRRLIKGWAKVQGFSPDFWTVEDISIDGVKRTVKKPRGTPFESYAIMEKTEWDMPAKPRKVVEYEDKVS